MRYLTCLFLLICFRAPLHAQNSLSWQKIFHNTRVGTVLQTDDTSLIIPMSLTDSASDITYENLLYKINRYGQKIGSKDGNFPGIAFKRGFDLYSRFAYSSFYDVNAGISVDVYQIIDFNEQGKVLWKSDEYRSDTSHYLPYNIVPLADSAYILLGSLWQYPGYDPSPVKMLAQKFTANHTLVWSDTFAFARQTWISGAAILSRENRIIIGGSFQENPAFNDNEGFLVMINTDGSLYKYIPFGTITGGNESIRDITQLQNGHFVVESTDWSGRPVFLRLIGDTGNLINGETIVGLDNGWGGIEADGDSLYLFGSIGLIWGPLVLVKLDTGFNEINHVLLDNNKYFYNGPVQMFKTYDGSLVLSAYRSMDEGTKHWTDFLLFHFGKDFRFDQIADSFPNEPVIVAEPKITCQPLYPDPAEDMIHFNLHTGDVNFMLSLDIYDCRGRMVITYPQFNINGGSKDISFLANGLYMYRLYNDKQVYCTGKFIKE